MAVLRGPEVGAESAWMRNALLVVALAEAGEAGAMGAVPGASLLPRPRGAFPVIVLER